MMIYWSYKQTQGSVWIFSRVQRDVLLLFLLPVVVLWMMQQWIPSLRPLTAMDIVQVQL